MSEDYGALLKTEDGLVVHEVAGKKFRLKQPVGTLILTNKTLIFAPASHGTLKSLGALVAPPGLGQKVAGKLTQVKADDLREAMQREGSFHIQLPSIVEVRAERRLGFGAPFLRLKWKTQEGEFSAKLSKTIAFKGFKSWVDAIEVAKKEI